MLEQALSAGLPADPVRGDRPALPIRLMAGLLYLKHAYDLPDEAVCERWTGVHEGAVPRLSQGNSWERSYSGRSFSS